MVITTDSCSLQAQIDKKLFATNYLNFASLTWWLFNTCVYSTFVKISTFCLNSFARCVSKSCWLLPFWILERLNFSFSSRKELLLDEAELPLLSALRCFVKSWGKICFTSLPVILSCNIKINQNISIKQSEKLKKKKSLFEYNPQTIQNNLKDGKKKTLIWKYPPLVEINQRTYELLSVPCAVQTNKAKQQLHFQIISKIKLVFLFLKQKEEHTYLNPIGCGEPLLQEKCYSLSSHFYVLKRIK